MLERFCATLAPAALLAGLTMFGWPQAAAAQDSFAECHAAESALDQRLSACTAVIEGGTETGRRLAVAYCNRGHVLTERRELQRAVADLSEAIRLDAHYACAFNNRARAFAFMRDHERALADYDRAIAIDPKFALAYNNRGDLWVHAGKPDLALADFDRAIAPGFAPALESLKALENRP